MTLPLPPEAQADLAYRIVSSYWGGRHAARSGLAYMKHIDDGLRILGAIGADPRARAAFCLHPLYQGEAEPAAHPALRPHLQAFAPETLAYAADYARIANSYLSAQFSSAADAVPLSRHRAVNDMLIADKVQNRYDFLYLNPDLHAQQPERAARLAGYFANWLRALDVEGEKLARLEALIAPPGPYLRTDGPAPPQP